MSVQASGEWFLTAKGEKLGPVTMEELREFAQLGGLNPREDMVWKEGMAEWVAAGEVEGLFELRSADEPMESPGMAATVTSAGGEIWGRDVDDGRHRELARPWPGIGRLGFFMGTSVIPAAGWFGLMLLVPLVARFLGPDVAQYVPWLALGLLVIIIYAMVMRFPNLGMSRWWALGWFVPLLNWWVGFRCFACPPGYAMNRRLDTLGWILAVLYWLVVAANVISFVVMLVMFGAAVGDPERWQDLMRQLDAGSLLPK